MNDIVKEVYKKRIARTAENLKKNNMDAYCVDTKEDALKLAVSFLEEGESIACGGSATLKEVGISEYLLNNRDKYDYMYRDPAYTPEQTTDVLRKSLLCDTYITSTNALTEKGELVNIDGTGNRVAAITFGPKNVIVVTGCNKICRDAQEGYNRVKEIAAPANTIRLNSGTPCSITGKCADCKSPGRVCCDVVITQYQRVKGRIKVIIVCDELGF